MSHDESDGPGWRIPSLPGPPVRVHKAKASTQVASLVRKGHAWIYAGQFDEPTGPVEPGSLLTLYDAKNRFLAIGMFDPESPLRLRVLQRGSPARIDDTWLRARLEAAAAIRAGLPATGTTGYRLVHGENDGLPGVVLDRYDATLVLKLYTSWWVPRLSGLLDAIRATLSFERLVLRLPRALSSKQEPLHGLRDGQILAGADPGAAVPFLENGLHFEADVVRGQKTGFFLDQRDNRLRVRGLAKNRRVLNICSHVGGFSVYAAAGGARAVISLDLSSHALEGAVRNFALNPSLASVPHETIAGNAFDRLAELVEDGVKYDLVVLDPPSFAMRKADREGAFTAYETLNARAAALVKPGGILVTCSCSAHITESEFADAVRRGLRGRDFRLIESTGHGVDHPITFPEGRYLKAMYLEIRA